MKDDRSKTHVHTYFPVLQLKDTEMCVVIILLLMIIDIFWLYSCDILTQNWNLGDMALDT